MADEFQLGSGNWWEPSSRNRFESGASSPSSTARNTTSISSFGWPTEIVDAKARSSMDSLSSSSSSVVLSDPNLHMMGLGLPSPGIDWNQALLRSEKAESNFRNILQDDLSSNTNTFQQINRGLSLDQSQYSSHISPSESSMDLGVYGSSGSPSTMLQGLLLGSDNQAGSVFDQNRSSTSSTSYAYHPTSYGMNNSGESVSSWSKFPQFLRNSPPKQQPPNHQLHFSNNAPFWNASSAAPMTDVNQSAGFFSSLQMNLPSTTFDEKPKNTSEVRDIAPVGKKSSNESSNKRPRNETTPAPLPAFKVRKEKMGDRITALQQLVSPFGKTDTASVLSEAIEYIKFLHEQIGVLSTPYMKSGAPIQHQQNSDKFKDPEGTKQDLRSRGLCLVPVSSTYPAMHETTVDFWTPTFGGTFR
ncbi:hypothetical protein RJ640_004578 [Escallonia rubra]|uniref:BHLH domain-containing protein n=1 Tax=Escallonia rubra TaxID=112253 RepID=A0AA88R8W8_9ASTE|nr:hypothetical protein RJ640_004578 [Escallonia rubra]